MIHVKLLACSLHTGSTECIVTISILLLLSSANKLIRLCLNIYRKAVLYNSGQIVDFVCLFVFVLWPSHAAFGILFPRPGIEPGPRK